MFRTARYIWLIVTFVSLPVHARQTQDEPAVVPEARKAVAAAVAALAGDLRSPDPAARRAARKAFVDLGDSFCRQLLAQTVADDPERRIRIRAVLAEVAEAANRSELLWSLSAPERDAVNKLAKAEAEKFTHLLSDDPEVAARAVKDLVGAHGPAAEPIVRWTIRSRRRQVRRAGLALVPILNDPGRRLGDLLIAHWGRIARQGERFGFPNTPNWELQQARHAERGSTLAAMRVVDPQAALPAVLRALVNANSEFPRIEAARLVLAARDRRVVPTLMSSVGAGRFGVWQHSTTVGGERITQRPVDAIMWILIHQTGQSPQDYGLRILRDHGDEDLIGFEVEKARKAARGQLRAWWARNRAKYENVEKIDLKAVARGKKIGARGGEPGAVEIPAKGGSSAEEPH